MRQLLLLLMIAFTAIISFGQHVEETYPKTLWCPDDSFYLKYDDDPRLSGYAVSTIKTSPGTDGSIGGYFTLFYGNDSVRFNFNNNIPYQHVIFVNLESPKGKTKFRFHFNEIACFFPEDYMKKNKGNVQFDIPEPYELANIIWTISPSGERATDLYKDGDYYKKVIDHFQKYKSHPVFKQLDFPDSLYADKYYDFRENSFAFNFKDPEAGSADTKLLFNGPYYYAYGQELADSSLFGKLKPLVEDFAKQSGFRKFYANNLSYYQKGIQRQKELLPVNNMWQWLEKEFPGRKYQSYRIVFSPLIGGSHSTQQYSRYHEDKWFSEVVMFICGTDRYDKMNDLNEKQKEGLMSGIVFTEIDHNYVNPATNKYRKRIDSIMSNREVWAKKSLGSDFYSSTVSVFNEYMTHALFCLYILDNYDSVTANLVISRRESLMVDRRNFIRFKEFNQELIRLRKEKKDMKVIELYPFILDWMSLVPR